MQDSLATS